MDTFRTAVSFPFLYFAKIILRAAKTPFTGLIQAAGRTFDTPGGCISYNLLKVNGPVFGIACTVASSRLLNITSSMVFTSARFSGGDTCPTVSALCSRRARSSPWAVATGAGGHRVFPNRTSLSELQTTRTETKLKRLTGVGVACFY